jgi:hypothetical protein
MRGYDVHLVGSIPLRSAREVFEVVSSKLGPRLRRIPDGETGERSQWLGWIAPIFTAHPAFEPTGEMSRVHATSDPRPLHRIKPGFATEDLHFDNLRIADHAVDSFTEFQDLKRAGVVPPQCRFQVSLANPISVVHRFVVDEFQEAAVAAYERAMIAEISKMAARIPPDQLAIQLDIAQHVFKPLETGEANCFGQSRREMLQAYSAMAIRWGNAIPPDSELLYHLCYGNNAGRHAVEPASLDVQVHFANALSAGIGRSIDLIHMSVPRDRDDDAYFAPLRRLELRPETRIALGLVHATDGVEGSRRRIATAEKYLSEFLIATECGFGRRPPSSIPRLLDIHAELAGMGCAERAGA